MDYISVEFIGNNINPMYVWPAVGSVIQAVILVLYGYSILSSGGKSKRAENLVLGSISLAMCLVFAPVFVVIVAILIVTNQGYLVVLLLSPCFILGNAVFPYLCILPVDKWIERDYILFFLSIATWSYLDNITLNAFVPEQLLLPSAIALYVVRWALVYKKLYDYGNLPEPDVKSQVVDRDEKVPLKTMQVV
ncbi:hypothetical protein MP228_011442 [Amoeboaphelidium protococcarum]|nr:hypothetical protein MP228_011442 [Amoeboaphelidium protococcarum]